MSDEASNPPTSRPSNRFATTNWSIVLASGRRPSPDADVALDKLCRLYWYPLYAFARRRGCSPDDAAELTQEFFARLLERDFLQSADREKGRFRTFLLTIFQRFIAKQSERRRAIKRGGDRALLSIDASDGERRYAFEPADGTTAEALFERRWALTVLDRALQRLQDEFAEKNKQKLFENCQKYLAGPGAGPSYGETATVLGMTEVAVRVAVHRMRDRYGELVRQEVAATVGSCNEVEDELRLLQKAISTQKK